MKKAIIIVSIFLGYLFSLSAQEGVSINKDGTTSDASAILDLQSTNQGFLMPRLTEVQKNAISNPADWLMIIQTDGTEPGPYIYDGTAWQYMFGSSSSSGCLLTATATVTDVSSNGGSDGTATVTPSGGISPHTYQWSGGKQQILSQALLQVLIV